MKTLQQQQQRRQQGNRKPPQLPAARSGMSMSRTPFYCSVQLLTMLSKSMSSSQMTSGGHRKPQLPCCTQPSLQCTAHTVQQQCAHSTVCCADNDSAACVCLLLATSCVALPPPCYRAEEAKKPYIGDMEQLESLRAGGCHLHTAEAATEALASRPSLTI
jgi:hypothetical protein